jgi:ferrous iron transport protein A
MPDTLQTLAIGDAGRVAGFAKGATGYRRRLLAMGLTPGTGFEVARCAPMGDPVEIRVRGFSLSLRKEEAAALLVERGQP